MFIVVEVSLFVFEQYVGGEGRNRVGEAVKKDKMKAGWQIDLWVSFFFCTFAVNLRVLRISGVPYGIENSKSDCYGGADNNKTEIITKLIDI